MTDPTQTTPTHLDPKSIEMLVAALERYKALLASGKGISAAGFLSVVELMAFITPHARVGRLATDAEREALVGFVRDVGWQAYIAGGLGAMDDTLKVAARSMPGDEDFAVATIDAWWKGIGSWV